MTRTQLNTSIKAIESFLRLPKENQEEVSQCVVAYRERKERHLDSIVVGGIRARIEELLEMKEEIRVQKALIAFV